MPAAWSALHLVPLMEQEVEPSWEDLPWKIECRCLPIGFGLRIGLTPVVVSYLKTFAWPPWAVTKGLVASSLELEGE